MAAMCDIVAVVGHRRLQSMPLAILTMKKELHGFLFLYMHVAGSVPVVIVLCLATFRAARALLSKGI